jgi:hypothetical protein
MPTKKFYLPAKTRRALGLPTPTRMRKYKRVRPTKRRGKKYAPTPSFQKQMKLYENQHVEKKFIPLKNRTNGPARS